MLKIKIITQNLDEIDKGRCISIDVRLNPPEAMGIIIPCLCETGTNEPIPERVQKLLDKAAYSMNTWTKLCFIGKTEFLAYSTSSCQGKFSKQPKHTDPTAPGNTEAKTLAPPDKISSKYNSRSSTVEQRNLQTKKESEIKSKQTKEEKEAVIVEKLREKIQVLESEKQSLKQMNAEIKATRKVEVDTAVAKAESKTDSKIDRISKQLDLTQQSLVKANMKVQDLSCENTELKTKKKELDSKLLSSAQRSTGNILTTPVATESKPTSTLPQKLPTPSSIAEEYKLLTTVVQDTETAIAIKRIRAENTIALAKMDEAKLLEVSQNSYL